MYCYNIKSGKELWRQDLNVTDPRNTSYGVTYSNGLVYGGSARKIVALNAETGGEVWSKKNNHGEGSPFRLTVCGDKLLVGLNWSKLIAINKNTGKTAWNMSEKGYSYTVATPYNYDNKLLLASNGKIAELNVASGKMIKEKEYDHINFNTASTPAYSDGVLYYGTANAGVVAISRETLQPVWTFKTRNSLLYTAPYSKGEISTVEGSIAVKGNNIIFGASDGYLYVVDKNSGEKVYEFNIGSPILTAVKLYENSIIVADFSGKVTKIYYPLNDLGKN